MAESLSGLDNLVAGLSVFTAPGMEKYMLNAMRTRSAAQPLLATQAIYYCRIVEGVVATLFPEASAADVNVAPLFPKFCMV
jgi:uncharacterized protein YjeT (DUF2065 family)